jgi:hypothetical protein
MTSLSSAHLYVPHVTRWSLPGKFQCLSLMINSLYKTNTWQLSLYLFESHFGGLLIIDCCLVSTQVKLPSTHFQAFGVI